MAKFTPKVNDKKEFNKLKSRARRVIKRASEHGFDIGNEIELPRSITAFKTRKEFNAYIDNLNKWSHPSNRSHSYVKTTNGEFITQRELDDFNQATRIVNNNIKRDNRNIKNLRKNLGLNEDGSLGDNLVISAKVYGQDDNGYRQPLKESKSFQTRDLFKKRFANRLKQIDPAFMQKKQETMRDNFLNQVMLQYGPESYEVVNKIKNMEFEDFFAMYTTFDEFQRIFYGSDQDEMQNINSSYMKPKVEELESNLAQFERMKNEANNK